MKSFPSAFAIEKNKPVGAKPIWIMKFTINSITYWLSGKETTIPAFTGSSPWPASTVVTTLPIVKSWGSIHQGITNWLSEFQVSEFSVTLILNTNYIDLENLLLQYPIESNSIELYEWFIGCTDCPQRLFHGYVRDITNLTDLTVDLSIQDDTIKLEGAYIGTRVSTTTYPTSDPDDIGKLIPIVYNNCLKVPPVCVKAGIATTISAQITDTDTTIYLSDMLSGVTYTGLTFLIDYEKVYVTGYSYASKYITVTRGYSSTIALYHSSGTVIYQWSSSDPLVWLFDNAMTSISTVYARIDNFDVDITNDVTVYLGTTGHELSGYPGKAAIVINNIPAISKEVALDYSNALSVAQGSHQHPANVAYTTVAPDTWSYTTGPNGETGLVYSPASNWTASKGGPQNLYDGNDYSFSFLGLGGNMSIGYCVRLYRTASVGSGTPVNVRGNFIIRRFTYEGYDLSYYRLVIGGVAQAWQSMGRGVGGYHNGSYLADYDVTPVSISSGWYTLTSWSTLYASNTYIEIYMPRSMDPNAISGSDISIRGDWNSVTSYSVNDVVRYAGEDWYCKIANSNQTPSVGGSYWDDIQEYTSLGAICSLLYKAEFEVETGAASTYAAAAGVELEGSLQLTGNSVADIRIGKVLVDCTRTITRDNIFNDIISRAGQSLTISNVGTPSIYTFNGCITEYQTALWWLNYLALQAQAWFAIVNGTAKLINRPRTLVDKIIPACKIADDGQRVLSRKKTDITDVINKINLLYKRDWTVGKGDTSYQLNLLAENSTSKTTYGLKEQASTFQFDFITVTNDATDLNSFYLTNYKDRHWIAEFDVFLDHSELEFGDYVQLGFLNNICGTVIAASHTPGSFDQIDVVHLTILIL